jgi:hypothetical protein
MFDTPSRGHSRRPGDSSRRFALRRTVDKGWIIVHAQVPEFAVRPLAHITIDDDDVAEVIWTAPLPLPVMFATPQDALQSLEDWERGREGATKPIPIPHFAPRGGISSASA